ncbi:hypothetical protein GCM10023216_10230 [Isoptericola chiayiensis]|uniref:Uncharacterized protein n=1 Tax=Isoptericola chiayiensis TaxID=579446 RepID=A0ABP8Y6D1_9MICO
MDILLLLDGSQKCVTVVPMVEEDRAAQVLRHDHEGGPTARLLAPGCPGRHPLDADPRERTASASTGGSVPSSTHRPERRASRRADASRKRPRRGPGSVVAATGACGGALLHLDRREVHGEF